MNTLTLSRFVLVFLALCIFLSGQAMQPSLLPIFLPVFETAEVDSDETDNEDDFLASSLLYSALFGLVFSKTGRNHLEFQAACLAPVAPPPKPA